MAGHNRSALIVAVEHLRANRDTNVIEAVRHIRKKRGNVALQNEGFQEQLVAYARIHNLSLGETPVPSYPAPGRITRTRQRSSPLDKLALR